ncbi:MAG: cytochrome C [Candidatus Eisenbacteria bacterium]|nr:cytochrome C [Candidatus Eisenbacteria bacterium]
MFVRGRRGRVPAALAFALVTLAAATLFSPPLSAQEPYVIDKPGSGAPIVTEPEIPAGSVSCLNCHQKLGITGSAIRDWKASKHSAAGIGCAECHYPVSAAPREIQAAGSVCPDPKVRRGVSPANCAECHADQAAQFERGKHSKAWLAMSAMPETYNQPHAIAGTKGCGGCHRIGLDSGKCDACHTRHLFSAAEARRPEACRTCHMGFDHPQWEMYDTSKHGSIYATEGDQWNFDRPVEQWFDQPNEAEWGRPRAPVCVTCHMSDGSHEVRTAWGFLALRLPEPDPEWMQYRAKILQGLGVLDEKGNPTPRLGMVVGGDLARLQAEDWGSERKKMLGVCSKCHAPSFGAAQMADADSIIKAADALMAEAITVVEGLYADKILKRPAFAPLAVDLLRFYEVENPIEQKLYTMFLEHRQRTFQGAFHMNPDYQHWYGWAEMKRDLIEIRAEAKELRERAGK